MKKIFIILGVVALGLIISLPGCNNSEKSETSKDISNYELGNQVENPENDEEIAIVETNMGTFKMRFFQKDAPKAVENFKGLAKKSYYDNLTFHRIIDDFMIQGGDPTGTGAGGESLWGSDFEDEFSKNLFNITGAVSMANRGPNTNGSQFFINNQHPENFKGWEQFDAYYNIYTKDPEKFNKMCGGTVDMSKITDDIKNLYNKHGGNPTLDGYYNTAGKGHTVFAQVFEGMDVVDKISKCKTDENNKPLEPVIIKSIKFDKYKKNWGVRDKRYFWSN